MDPYGSTPPITKTKTGVVPPPRLGQGMSIGAEGVTTPWSPATSAPLTAPPPPPPPPHDPPAAGVSSPNLVSELPPQTAAYAQQTAQPQSPIQSAFQGSLLNLLNRSQQTPSLEDPALKAQSEVFRAGRQRSAERERASAAERMAQQGLGESGAFDTVVGQIENARGFDEANFNANLIGGEIQARRQELQDALRLAAATGDSESARALQKELAVMDFGLRERGQGLQQQGLNLQERLGLGDLDIRKQGLAQQGQLGRGDLALRLMLGLQGNQQFYDQLGLGASQWLADYNQRNFMDYWNGGS
jgi:hypothetical protein